MRRIELREFRKGWKKEEGRRKLVGNCPDPKGRMFFPDPKGKMFFPDSKGSCVDEIFKEILLPLGLGQTKFL